MNQGALLSVSSCYYLVTCSDGLGEEDIEGKGELDVCVMFFFLVPFT